MAVSVPALLCNKRQRRAVSLKSAPPQQKVGLRKKDCFSEKKRSGWARSEAVPHLNEKQKATEMGHSRMGEDSGDVRFLLSNSTSLENFVLH